MTVTGARRHRLRGPLALVAMAVVLLAGALAGVAPAAGAPAKPRVTLIGDSITASFASVPAATRALGAGLDLRVDARVCRRLVAPSCTHRGRPRRPSCSSCGRAERRSAGS